jgi:ribosomal protein S27E
MEQATKIAEPKAQMPKVATPKAPKEPKPKTTEIACVDCGERRTIATQDAFQVRRCVACQAEYRKEQRKQYRKNRIRGLQERILALETQLSEHGIAV